MQDTWHFMSGSGGATCPGQNGSNNEPSGAHMRHMASCHWRKIHGRWIRDKVKSKSTNEGLTCGNRKDKSLDPCLTNQFGRGDRKPRKDERF